MDVDKEGRPSTIDEQFQIWLEDLRPFLKFGSTLNYAIEKADLSKHRTTLYEKYRLGDWFSDKIDTYRSYLGEIVNDIFGREVLNIEDAQKQGRQVTEEQWRNLRFFAEKHRSSSPFFVNKQEVAQVGLNEMEATEDRLDKEVEAQNEEEFIEEIKKEQERRNAEAERVKTMPDEELAKILEKAEANSMNTTL